MIDLEQRCKELTAELQKTRLEEEFAHDREQWLEQNTQYISDAITALSHVKEVEKKYVILLNVLHKFVDYEQVVTLSRNSDTGIIEKIYASHEALKKFEWRDYGVIKDSLDLLKIMILSEPSIAKGFDSDDVEFKHITRSVLLIPMQLHNSKLLFILTHQRQLAFSIESEREIKKYYALLSQVVNNIDYSRQLEDIIANNAVLSSEEQDNYKLFTQLSSEIRWQCNSQGVFIPIYDIESKISKLNTFKHSAINYKDFLGKKLVDLCTESDLEEYKDLYRIIEEKYAAHESFENVEIPLTIDGKKIWLLARSIPYFDKKTAEFLGYQGVFVDITKEHNQNIELKKVKNEAEMANRSKSEYLAVMSHEIKTPLQAILGMLDLLEQTSLEETQMTYINHISQSASLLQTILHDVLDLSRIESQAMVLENETFDIKATLDSISVQMREKAETKNIYLKLIIDPDFPQNIQGDQHRLSQVLFNLINNAIKFTSTGGITVSAKQFDTRLKFSVVDTGTGIPSESLSTLFVPFVQLDGSISRKYGGSGLGLAICKRLIEHMDGRIGVKSEVGKGTEFWFEIPCHIPNTSIIDAHAIKRTVVHKEHNYHILLVEDSQINQFVIKTMLEKLGHTVMLASNGVEAIEAVKKSLPELVLMDIRMPVMDGIEATRHIVNEVAYVPIVALTANSTDEERIACREAGMVSIASKPVTSIILRKLLLELEGVIEDTTQNLINNGFKIGEPCTDNKAVLKVNTAKNNNFFEESSIAGVASFGGKQFTNVSMIDALIKSSRNTESNKGTDYSRIDNDLE